MFIMKRQKERKYVKWRTIFTKMCDSKEGLSGIVLEQEYRHFL